MLKQKYLNHFTTSTLNGLSLILLLCISCLHAAEFALSSSSGKQIVVAKSALPSVPKIAALQVNGSQLQDIHGKPMILAGVSFFWSNSGWQGAKFYQPDVVDYFVDQWKVNLVRVAVGIDASGGLLDDPDNLKRAQRVIEQAIRRGIYVLIDFHSHHAEDHQDVAQQLFEKMAISYGQYPNVIYEIYNEPLPKADWQKVIKPYAETIIRTIRAHDKDNLIVVGTRSWSQRVDEVVSDPIKDKNVAYSLHFYAGTHHQLLIDKAQYALKQGVPLFVTEWGSVAATGDGAVDAIWTKKWHQFIRDNQLSHANWSVSDKKEAASIFGTGYPAQPIESLKLTKSGNLAKEMIALSRAQKAH